MSIHDFNPYYSPEKCGLEIFISINTAIGYNFDLFVIWKKLEDGTLWYDCDEGCSCPTPFDNHDLKPITKDSWYWFEDRLKNHNEISKTSVIETIKK